MRNILHFLLTTTLTPCFNDLVKDWIDYGCKTVGGGGGSLTKQQISLWCYGSLSRRTFKNTATKSRLTNPIENIFHIVSRKLQKDAIDQSITRESYQEFCDRVRRTIYDISHQLIDKTIESMNTRIADIVRNNGERLSIRHFFVVRWTCSKWYLYTF